MKELEILLNKRWILKSRDKETYYKLRDALGELDRKSTRLNSSHSAKSRMPSSA